MWIAFNHGVWKAQDVALSPSQQEVEGKVWERRMRITPGCLAATPGRMELRLRRKGAVHWPLRNSQLQMLQKGLASTAPEDLRVTGTEF